MVYGAFRCLFAHFCAVWGHNGPGASVVVSLGKKPPQKVSLKQGLAVPLFCSASLFGFYCLLRFFPDLDVRTFISLYLGVAGAAAVASNLSEPLRLLLPNTSTSWKIGEPYLSRPVRFVSFRLGTPDLGRQSVNGFFGRNKSY